MRLLALALALPSCASLRVGWARVEWLDGGVRPVVQCTARVAADGEIEMTCRGMGKVEGDLLWRLERQRVAGGET